MDPVLLNEMARYFNALGHPVRLALVIYLSRSKKGVVWEALRNALKESSLSVDIDSLRFHLNVLVKSNVVLKVKVSERLWAYKLNPEVKRWVKLSNVRSTLFKNTPEHREPVEESGEGATASEVYIKR